MGIDVEVHGRLDDPSFRRAAERAGGRAGDRFATAFGLSATRRWRRMTRLFMEPINAVSAALSAIRGPSLRGGILAGLLGLIPSLGKATAAVGAGLIPALLSLGSVIGVVRLMLGDLSKRIDSQVLKQLNAMAGSIRELAREAVKPGLNAFLSAALRQAPLLRNYVREIAEGVGGVGLELAGLLRSPVFQGKLKTLLEGTARATRAWLDAVDAVVDMVVTLGAAAVPIFDAFAGRLAEVVERWRDWLNLKSKTGELQAFLKDAAEELNRWGRIFTNIIVGLYNIFAAGVGPSSRFAENLERMTRSFRDWTESSENVEKVRRAFQWMVDHVDGFFRVAASAAAIAVALKGVGAAMEVIDFVRMAAMLGPVGIAFAAVGLAIAGVAAAFFLAYNSSELFRAKVGELWAKIQEDLFPILKEWGAWFEEELAPVLEKFANETLQKIIDGFDGLITKYNENREGIQEMRQLFLDLMPVISFFSSSAVEELTGFAGQIMTVVGWVGRLVGVIKKIPLKWITKYLFSPGAAISWILRVTGLTRRIPRAWRTVYRFLGSIGPIRNVINWIARIPRNVSTTFTSVTRNITESIIRAANPFARASGGLIGAQGMQTGGLVGSRAVLVGEHGPEFAELPFGSRVAPAGQTRAALAGGGGGGSGDRPLILKIHIGGRELAEVLVDPMRKEIRTRGGDVQAVLGSG